MSGKTSKTPATRATDSPTSTRHLYWDSHGGTIMKANPHGTVTTLVTGQNGPRGVAVDNFGNIYWANQGAGTIMKANPYGTVTTLVTGQASPTGVAVDSSGNIYWANQGAGTIMKAN